ncbi:chymotrypsin-like elastase family member 1 [Copidosoma floridanum]|uniref:chymotrypsin-like elastase family member 1 n=1 Tax=Copidosoma floridanum TaxID=29053 RepID=UPI0006C9850D|nr:chymotrypsin-like elastase family member 1 [Copidosoma floridanum]
MVLLKILAALSVIQAAKSERWNSTTRKEFPFVVNVLRPDPHRPNKWHSLCHGALIKKNYVLTTAGCVFKKDDQYVIEVNEKKIHTDKIITHESYRDSLYANNYIAILELAQEVELDESVNVVNLPEPNEPIHKNRKSILTRSPHKGSKGKPLQFMETRITNDISCAKKFSDRNKGLPQSRFCIAAGTDYRKGPLGLLLVQKHESKTVLIGIIIRKLNLFTPISFYVDWIDSKINGRTSTVDTIPTSTTKKYDDYRVSSNDINRVLLRSGE